MRSLPVLLVAVLVADGCSRTSKPLPGLLLPGKHVLVGSKGTVEILRPNWKRYSPVSFGVIITPNDIVRVLEGGEARVVCADLSEQILRFGPPGPVPCPTGGELGFAPQQLLLRGESGCIALISPRAGLLFDARPDIRWKAIAETRNYHVETKAGDVAWSRDIRLAEGALEGHLAYPGNAGALPAGSSVSVVVTGYGRSSAECAPSKAAIQVLTGAERSGLETADGRLRKIDLPDEERDYLRASLMLARGVSADAITLLEKLTQRPAKMAAVYRLLGDAYASLELSDQAEKAYQDGLALATASDDLGSKAWLTAAVASLTRDATYRKKCAEQAVSLYKELGDSKRAAELAEELR